MAGAGRYGMPVTGPVPTVARSRAIWALGSQALSSSASFVPLFLVLHAAAPEGVGAFGLAYTTYFFLLTVVRGLALEPLTVRFSGRPADELRDAAARAVGLALAASTVIGAVLAVGFAFAPGTLGRVFVALGVTLPLLLLNDALRNVFFASAMARRACLNDGFFVLVEVVLLAGMSAVTDLGPATLMLTWGVAAGMAALVAMRQLRLVPAVSRARSWLSEQRDLGLAFAGDHAVARGAEQAAFVIIGALGGLATLGAVSACRSLFAPASTVQAGLTAFAVPEASRLVRDGRERTWRGLVLGVAIGVAVLMAATGGLLAVVPDDLGVSLFQQNWAPLQAVLLPTTVSLMLAGIAFALWLGMRSRDQAARATLVARATTGLLTVAAVAAGVRLDGASGATWGLALGSGCLCLFFAYYLFGRRPVLPAS